jgi:hypothetical protein
MQSYITLKNNTGKNPDDLECKPENTELIN